MNSSTRLVRGLLAVAAVVFAAGAAATGANDHHLLPIPTKPGATARPSPKYNQLFGGNIGRLSPLRWRYNHSRAPAAFAGDPVGAVAQVRAALDSWTQVCGVTYEYEGETTIAPDTRVTDAQLGEQPDFVNVVGWGGLDTRGLDAHTAGVTWSWYDDQTGELLDSDIILSIDFVQSAIAMERTATHEWGHALGLDHSEVGGALMAGPPFNDYNSVRTLHRDDILGCRCMYGGSTINPAGFSCSLPKRIELGAVPVGGTSSARTINVENHGNAPLTIKNVAINSLRVTRDNGCPAGRVLAPGDRCTVTIVATPPLVFNYTDTLTINTSDGPYAISVAYAGTDGPVFVPPVVQLVEYFHAAFGHYFVTHITDEITRLDDGTFAGWARTGRTINAWTAPAPGSAAVCRFFSASFAPKSSHFYTSFADECQVVARNASWSFEGQVFHVGLPDSQGACAAGTQRVYRLYNNGRSGAPNHRFTTDASLRAQMIEQGWVPEGTGDGVTMCAPV